MTSAVANIDEPKGVDLAKTDGSLQTVEEGGAKKPELPMLTPEDSKIPTKVWVILFISCMGVLMASIQSTALIIVFPTLLVDLDCTIATMMYILLLLMLVIAGSVGIVGKLGAVTGQAILYKAGMFIFTLGCFIGGFANKKYNGHDLLGARCIIGLGAAFLFTNSSAILTNAFAPYNKVGLSQGIFQISSAAGMVLGPVVGGGFDQTNWRWIFFWNVPVGGLCFLLSLWAVQEQRAIGPIDWVAFGKTFDWVGAVFYPTSLALTFIALIQLVAPNPDLDQVAPLAAIITVAAVCGIVFAVNEFFAVDPLCPPSIFLQNRVFSASTMAGTAMAFVRNSITYNFIFYFQGPQGMSPLDAGIALIPFGAGVMAAGFVSGYLADKVAPRYLSGAGTLVTLAANIVFLFFDKSTSAAEYECLLLLAGLGMGLFQSPNNMSMMLSVLPAQRGVAAAISMLTLMATGMLGIVLTFQFVLNSMTQAELFDLFIYGGGSLSAATIHKFLKALQEDYYIVIACCCLAFVCTQLNNLEVNRKPSAKVEAATVSTSDDDLKKGIELVGSENKEGEPHQGSQLSAYSTVPKEEV